MIEPKEKIYEGDCDVCHRPVESCHCPEIHEEDPQGGQAESFPAGTLKLLGSILGPLEDSEIRPDCLVNAEVVIGQILADVACMDKKARDIRTEGPGVREDLNRIRNFFNYKPREVTQLQVFHANESLNRIADALQGAGALGIPADLISIMQAAATEAGFGNRISFFYLDTFAKAIRKVAGAGGDKAQDQKGGKS